jgi:hypothetical protein
MIRCTEGHFYDPAKHHACPWCPKPVELAAGAIPGGKTVPLRAEAVAAAVAPVAAAVAPVALPVGGKTVPLMRGGGKVEPVVGWLVAIEGADRGQDFRLKAGKNFVGRTAGMDVSVAGDESVSRERHAVVTFEPKKGTFWLGPGESSGLVYCNGEVVHAAMEWKAGDVMEVGQTKLVLVPFVTEGLRWDL